MRRSERTPLLKFSPTQLKFSPTFFKRRRGRGRGVLVALRRARKLVWHFFLIAFSSCLLTRRKADGADVFCFVYWLYLDFTCRGRRRRRPEKNHKKLFLLSRFSLTKSAAKVIKESFPLSLKSLPCRLAAIGANIASEPSRHSLATATGSKRSSADSDSLLCHVRLRQTSRLIFWRKSGCKHSKMGFALHNTHVTPHPSR